jgi:apolipoprotein N-acyltransferase
VPFGEYLPLRGLISHLAGTDLIPRDAIPGHGSGQIRTPSGPFGVVISYEVFFADRARSGIRAGGEVLLVPTNAASFRTSQVPTQEVAAARLRALETGRDVIQAAPTGYGAVIDSRGRVLARTHLGRQQVLQTVVHRRQGRTWYLRWGDGPVVTLALVVVAAGWIADRRRRTPLDRTV